VRGLSKFNRHILPKAKCPILQPVRPDGDALVLVVLAKFTARAIHKAKSTIRGLLLEDRVGDALVLVVLAQDVAHRCHIITHICHIITQDALVLVVLARCVRYTYLTIHTYYCTYI